MSNFALSLKTTSIGFSFFIIDGYFDSKALLREASLKLSSVTIISKFCCVPFCNKPVAKIYFCSSRLSTIAFELNYLEPDF